MDLDFVIISLIDPDLIAETLENVHILLWLLDYLNPLSSHLIHCPEDVKMSYPN